MSNAVALARLPEPKVAMVNRRSGEHEVSEHRQMATLEDDKPKIQLSETRWTAGMRKGHVHSYAFCKYACVHM